MSEGSKILMTIDGTDGLTKRGVADVVVERELDDFDQWLTTTFTGTSPMASFERAMVKTYLMHKLEDQIKGLPS